MNDKAEVMEFGNRAEYRKWLKINHKQENGIWIIFTKGNRDFTANDALEESICFGWIDGIMKSIDDKCYKKYFSRRKDTNKWSDKNKSIFKKLVKNKLMTGAGIEVFQPKAAVRKPEIDINEKIKILRRVLKEDKEILQLYDAATPSRQKQLAGFYCEAKTEETKNKRKAKITEALKNKFKGMLY